MRKLSGKKLLTATLLAATFAFGLVGCGSDDTSSEDAGVSEENVVDEADAEESVDTSELKPFRIGATGQDGGGVFESAALAVENGYFEEELKKVGFEPEYVYFNSGPEINEAFASDNIDAAILGDFPTFTAKSNGIDNKIIAMTNQKCKYSILINSDDIKTPKDLEGKKVIVPQGTVIQFFWENYAEATGIDTDKVEIINATSDATSLLQTGDADAYVATGYVAAYLSSIGLGTVLESDVDTSDIYATFVFTTSSALLDEYPDLGVAINKALIRAKEDAVADPDAQYEALASENIPAEAWEQYYSLDSTLSNLSPEITSDILEYYDKLSDWMVNQSIISEKVDITSFVDDTYYQKALETLDE